MPEFSHQISGLYHSIVTTSKKHSWEVFWGEKFKSLKLNFVPTRFTAERTHPTELFIQIGSL